MFQEPVRKSLLQQKRSNLYLPLEKNLNSVTAEALNIGYNILFNNSSKMKWSIIEFILHALSIRQIRFTFPSLENVDYEFKWTFQTIKYSIEFHQKKIRKYLFFLCQMLRGFKTRPCTNLSEIMETWSWIWRIIISLQCEFRQLKSNT